MIMETAVASNDVRVPGERPMPRHIRRSLFCLSIDDPKLGQRAYDSWADAIILDLARASGRDWQHDLRSRMPAAIQEASRGGAEVFVRVNAQGAVAELESTVFAGISGVVVKGVNTAAEVRKAAERLDRLEESRGIAAASLEIDVELTTAAGVWNALEIARASRRFGTLTLDERAVSLDLGMSCEPHPAFEPLEYIKSQIMTVAISAGGQAQGMSYPLSLTREGPNDDALKKAVRRARDAGFKGAVCPHVSWIKACNEGFRPSPEETAYYVKVREVFAEGLKRGMASVPIDGKMIDVPVDVRARLYLEWAARAKARDEEKARAHEPSDGTTGFRPSPE
jgi:citrate lyase subunit beta / citryl-CoA lyase